MNSFAPGATPALTKPLDWLMSAWKPASTCSTPPTFIRTANRKKFSVPPSPAAATKFCFPQKQLSRSARGPNDVGSSRYHLIQACEASLRRLNTDYIDLYQMHGFDALTPVEETLSALNDLVHSGKVRYIGCSNFSGWQLMKSLDVSQRYGWTRYVAHQAYYSLIGREYEWELMPLGLDQGVGCVVWSPLGWGRLTGKVRRGKPLPEVSRLHNTADYGPPVSDELV
jgi:aryl-alcohol dehydrogenase-like predicted oxidoreductase